jgi:hypothetical protein
MWVGGQAILDHSISFLPSFLSFSMIAFYEIQGAKGCRIHACAMHRGNLNLEPGFSRQL